MSISVPSKLSRDQESSENLRGISQNFISISSDQLQGQEQVQLIKPKEDDQLQPVSRPVNQQEQARKRQLKIQKAIEELNSIQMKKKEYSEVIEDVASKMENKRQMQKLEKQLKKEFEAFSYLPTSALSYVKGQLANFDKYCVFEQVGQYEKGYLKMRQDFRRLLTRGMLLSIQQIRFKVQKDDQTQLQQKLLNPETDGLKYCYWNASQLQKYFFTKLRKNATNGDARYQKQIKLIIREYSDKNNMELRRNIINKKVNYRQLAAATDQSIKCQKTLQEEKAKILQIIRQSQKDPFTINQIEEESQQPQVQMNKLHSMSSFGYLPEPIDQQPKQTLQQKNMRDKKELLIVLREKYKKCQQSFMKQSRHMRRMQEKLKQAHQNNAYFINLCKTMEIL